MYCFFDDGKGISSLKKGIEFLKCLLQFSIDLDVTVVLVFISILSLSSHFSHGSLILSGWDEQGSNRLVCFLNEL